jgi:hypothetical protein
LFERNLDSGCSPTAASKGPRRDSRKLAIASPRVTGIKGVTESDDGGCCDL